MAIACLYLQAAPDNFTVRPTAWTKLAVGNDVIIHKSPSTSSPTLVYNFDKMVYMNPYSSTRWTSMRPSSDEDYLYMSKESPILSEKNGWFEIPETGMDENVWVQASSNCWSIAPDQIYAGQYSTENFNWIDSPGDPAGGNYAIFMEPSRWADYGSIYLGRLIDGMVICPYEIAYHVDYENNTITLEGKQKQTMKITAKQLNDDLSPNLSRLGDRICDVLWRESVKMDTPVVVYRSANSGAYEKAIYIEKAR